MTPSSLGRGKKPSTLKILTLILNSLKGWNLDLLLPRAFHPYLFVQLLHGKLPSLCYNGFVLRAQTLVQIKKASFSQSLHLMCVNDGWVS